MEFGWCLPAGSFVPQMQDEGLDEREIICQLERDLPVLKQNGYDFAEMTVGAVVQLSADGFAQMQRIVEQVALPVPVFNSFVPPDLPLVGPYVDYDAVREHLSTTAIRVEAMGGKTVIFGSGGARRIPTGFSRTEALKQIVEFLKLCAEYLGERQIEVAVEPLNSGETNMITRIGEGLAAVKVAGLPSIKLLADLYHMMIEEEEPAVMQAAGDYLVHVHTANRQRRYPGSGADDEAELKAAFSVLHSMGYSGRIAVECGFDELAEDSRHCLAFLRQAWHAAKQ